MKKAKKLCERLSRIIEGATQNKVLAEIEKIAKDHDLDFDREKQYSNTGHIYFRRGLDTVANMSYDFQDDSSTFAIDKGKNKAQYFGNKGPGKSLKIFYIKDSSEYKKLFSAIEDFLR